MLAITVADAAAFVSYGPVGDGATAEDEAGATARVPRPPTVLAVADESALEVGAEQYVSVPFTVSDARPCRLTGRVDGLAGGRKDVKVLVLTADDFTNWSQRLSVTPVYGTEQVAALAVAAPLPGPGAYRLVLDNTFSAFTRKVIQLRSVRVVCGE